jgi:phospholipase C
MLLHALHQTITPMKYSTRTNCWPVPGRIDQGVLMKLDKFAPKALHALRVGLGSLALLQLTFGPALAGVAASSKGKTQSPIKHVIVIIGENHSFDNVFATYVPRKGERVWNLLSEDIVNNDGTPGRNFYHAEQTAASDPAADAFLLNPTKASFANSVLPAPLAGGPKDSFIPGDSLSVAQASENGLPPDYYQFLIGGGSGQTAQTPDQRITNVSTLPPGPFQLTNGISFVYDSYSASPVHRFYQMWQQLDCSLDHATPRLPSGCDSALFSWVEVTVGAGANGLMPPANFSTEYSSTGVTTGEGSTALGFYNMQAGDVPYFKGLADNYAMSDNFHQSVNGGTGANHIMLGHGDAIWFSDGAGNALAPPENVEVAPGTANAGIVSEVENPNPAPGTNNWYTQDGYGGGSFGAASFGGGSYSNCADATQPGVSEIVKYLASLPRPIDPRCEPNHFYLLNNYNPGYFGNGNNAFTDTSGNNTVFTIPPSSTPSIGDSLLAAKISWKYYGDQWNNYVPDPYQLNYGAMGADTDEYCNICNPFQYDTSIMTSASIRNAHIQDTANLYSDIADGTLPAVSFVKPSGLVDGHPASSKLDLFEGFTKKIIDAVQANPALWKDTAIFITFDEGGGYYDSGYVQPVDFFGDGTRIPFIVVSPFTKAGHISHDYTDHVSILKFIERNWNLRPVTSRSRDNFANPIPGERNPYVPINTPAIGDLFDLFDFGHRR